MKTWAPVGSLRWQLGLLASVLAGVAVALCPAWWAESAWSDFRAHRARPKTDASAHRPRPT